MSNSRAGHGLSIGPLTMIMIVVVAISTSPFLALSGISQVATGSDIIGSIVGIASFIAFIAWTYRSSGAKEAMCIIAIYATIFAITHYVGSHDL